MLGVLPYLPSNTSPSSLHPLTRGSFSSPGCQTTAGGMGNVTGILQVVARMPLNTHTQNSPTHGFVWLRKCQLFPLAQLLNQNPMLEVRG